MGVEAECTVKAATGLSFNKNPLVASDSQQKGDRAKRTEALIGKEKNSGGQGDVSLSNLMVRFY